MPRVRTRVLLVLGVLLVAIGCTPDADPAPPPEHPRAAVPADRDDRAVVAALRGIDPCALLDIDAARAPDLPSGAVSRPRGPHRCQVRSAALRDVAVVLGTPLTADERYGLELLDVGGVKAYVDRGNAAAQCRAYVPVSFTRAVEFYADNGPSGCDRVRAFVTAAAAELSRTDPPVNELPLSTWDACTALAAATGTPTRGPAPFGGLGDGMDRCSDAEGTYTLELHYGEDPGQDEETEQQKIVTIGGKRVRSYSIPQCVLAWRQGPALDGARGANVTVHAPDCTKAEPLAEAAMRRLAEPAPPDPVPVQRPVTYRPDEPDIASAGACVDAAKVRDCEPYHEVAVPAGRDEIVRAAGADPNVQCAIALEAVRRNYGPALMPVTAAAEEIYPDPVKRRCHFVEPSHGIRVGVEVPTAQSERAAFPQLGPAEVRIAGRAATAYDFRTAGTDEPAGRGVTVPLADDAGVLSAWVELLPPRDAGPDAPVDASDAAAIDRVAADIVTAHLA